MEEVSYLCGSVDEWQRRRIKDLEDNTVSYKDMAWKIEDTILPDCRQLYANSDFMNIMFKSPMRGNVSEADGLPVYPLDEKHNIFNMIRVFCHTGLVIFKRGETILRTIERYGAFHFYGMDEGKNALRRLILDNLTPSNSLTAFEYAVHRDEDLLNDIKSYICNYAFLVFRNRSLFNVRRDFMSEIVELCKSDNLNIKEIDLMSNMYRLCSKKLEDKEYTDFEKAFDIIHYKFDNGSIWDTIRLGSISMDDFMSFVQKNPTAMENDNIVNVMRTIHGQGNELKKRKKFQAVSSYPRNLHFREAPNPQMDVTHWERDKVQVFFAFNFDNKQPVALPSIEYRERHVTCTVFHGEKTIGIRGHVIKRHNSDTSGEGGSIEVTASFVNFRHDRWKKTLVSVKLTNPCTFEIPNILSWNAIESNGNGYLFDVKRYPEYSENGSWLMMSLSVSANHQLKF